MKDNATIVATAVAQDLEMPTPEQTDIAVRWVKLMYDSRIPSHLWGGLVRYFMLGLQPGHFLCAVLTNDLREAVQRADTTIMSQNGIELLIRFLNAHAPATAWGDSAALKHWLSLPNEELMRVGRPTE